MSFSSRISNFFHPPVQQLFKAEAPPKPVTQVVREVVSQATGSVAKRGGQAFDAVVNSPAYDKASHFISGPSPQTLNLSGPQPAAVEQPSVKKPSVEKPSIFNRFTSWFGKRNDLGSKTQTLFGANPIPRPVSDEEKKVAAYYLRQNGATGSDEEVFKEAAKKLESDKNTPFKQKVYY